MLIFVNNISLKIFDASRKLNLSPKKYTNIYDLDEQIVEFGDLRGAVLVKNIKFKMIIKFIEFIQNNSINGLNSIDFEVKNEYKVKYQLISKLHLIKAAGGVVKNNLDKKLMIKRLGVWDLPKGKAEKHESSKETAGREVEEECGVKIKVKNKICTTWHTYIQKGKIVIKQTKWYYMDLVSDKNMQPQAEEGIEDLQWMNDAEISKALKKSYHSIAYVMKKYYENN